MRVFIDTNILIDFVVNREGFSDDADKLFALGITGDIKLMTSALSYVTAMYIAHKYEYQDVKETLLAVSNFVDVLDLQGNTVIEMLSSDWKDYEDATQNATALRRISPPPKRRTSRILTARVYKILNKRLHFSVGCAILNAQRNGRELHGTQNDQKAGNSRLCHPIHRGK